MYFEKTKVTKYEEPDCIVIKPEVFQAYSTLPKAALICEFLL